ncbi:MAG: hypothetical protein JWP06_25 [Candidatus Saccharibacteria bacterium]|nr:hypothetical protein [Candidatus Saccharibacteria bacterium]
MSWYHPSTLFDKIFESGIIIKGVTGALEFLGGLLLFFFDPSVIHQFLGAITQKELIEDPHDKIATFLLQSTEHLGGGGSRTFLIVYLWIHAVIKLIAVIGILRNQLWAYPFSLVTLSLFVLYQLYEIALHGSIGMILLTIFDFFILWLIWREWGKVRSPIVDKRDDATRESINIRLFRTTDANELSSVIIRCLREVNSKDYAADIIEKMCSYFTPEIIAKLAHERQMFVAEQNGQPVGTVSRDGNKVFTMFVNPDDAGQGIGTKLMGYIEHLVVEEGFKYIETGASITAHDFYHKLGYVDVRESETDFGLNYILRKPLR